MSTSSTSIPRAATSVDTNTRSSPRRNRSITCSRCFCGMSPWIRSASTPFPRRKYASRSVDPFVLQNTIQRSNPVSSRIRAIASALSEVSMRNCLMSGLFSSSSRTVTSTASRWYTHAMSITSREIVAENIPRSFRAFIRSSSRVTSCTKPMSSIRSASSSTTVRAVSIRTVRRFRWSLRRPGVATTICGRLLSASICFPIGAPPYRHTQRTPGRYFASRRSSPSICKASSRVGDRITACTSPSAGSMCWTIGIPKARVFPVPVGAFAITSLCSIMGGMQPACTGVLITSPCASTARSISAESGSVSNRAPFVNSMALVPPILVFAPYYRPIRPSCKAVSLPSAPRTPVRALRRDPSDVPIFVWKSQVL